MLLLIFYTLSCFFSFLYLSLPFLLWTAPARFHRSEDGFFFLLSIILSFSFSSYDVDGLLSLFYILFAVDSLFLSFFLFFSQQLLVSVAKTSSPFLLFRSGPSGKALFCRILISQLSSSLCSFGLGSSLSIGPDRVLGFSSSSFSSYLFLALFGDWLLSFFSIRYKA